MNKLEVLYRMSKTMKGKNNIKGNVSFVGKSKDVEFANVTNNFEKDVENKTMKIDANIVVNTEDVQVTKSVKKDLDFNKMHEHHHGHHGHHGKCKKNKFAKLEMLFKTLNDMELIENGDEKVIQLDIKEMLDKKVEKMKAMHEAMGDKKECMHKCECEDLKELIKVKHAIFKEVCHGNYDKVMLKLTINKDFEIQSVNIKANGEKEVEFNAELNY
ncbi:hypothetical protein [uncultured Clostridium sp.]|uniref:hypothetical protein n=1 Tax=uncultured Clostridium sp. TaxID=59620 RepID=UPI0026028378|nr:hypothetical protein [uncultured Clostridium sp.]